MTRAAGRGAWLSREPSRAPRGHRDVGNPDRLLWGCGRGAGAGHFGDIGPAVNVLAGANPDGLAGARHAIPGNVKRGDVAPAVGRGRQQPQEWEVLHTADASADRGGALHQRVLGRRARDAELERKLASRVGRHQLGHWVGTEDRLSGREFELGQAEVGAPQVQAHKEVVAVEAHLAARFRYKALVGRGHAPGGALFGGASAPAVADGDEVAALALLLKGAGVVGAHVLAHNLAVTGVEIDDGGGPARLWNGADFHVVSGTRLLRCWLTRPQLGGYLNQSKTRASTASSINFSWVEWARSASATIQGWEIRNPKVETRNKFKFPIAQCSKPAAAGSEEHT